MANIFDYLQWRGDLTIQQSEFNEIDNLILSRFAYFPFDKIIKEDEKVTIKELSERFEKINKTEIHVLQKEDIELFPKMGNTTRFGNMIVTKYINKINEEQEKQFSAITIIMPDNTIYVSYRGTDNTLIGWKEDFNMSFKTNIAAQLDAVIYLEKIAKQYSNKLRIGGHSKGGNLAVYAAVFANEKTKKKIINIYNNDGPGFSEKIIQTEEYKEMIKKVHTFIPQSSVIGRLLNHEEKYTILKSTQKGIMQHDLYSWQLLGNKFIQLEEVTNGSELVDKTIKQWLQKVKPEQREQVIDIVFEILNTTDADTLSDIKSKWFTNVKTILQSYKNIDEESKQIISQTINSLFKITKNNIINQFPKFSEKTNK